MAFFYYYFTFTEYKPVNKTVRFFIKASPTFLLEIIFQQHIKAILLPEGFLITIYDNVSQRLLCKWLLQLSLYQPWPFEKLKVQRVSSDPFSACSAFQIENHVSDIDNWDKVRVLDLKVCILTITACGCSTKLLVKKTYIQTWLKRSHWTVCGAFLNIR